MITKERAAKAKKKLLTEVEQIEDHIAKMKAVMSSSFLDSWNGKLINARVHVPFARAMKCEEKERNGKPWFPNADFGFDYMPAPLRGKGVPQLKIDVCKDWGTFDVPLVCDYDHGYKMNAAETKKAWEQIIELRQSWADERKEAATKIAMAASAYNKIEAQVLKLFKNIGNEAANLDITVLRAFGGDIYVRLNKFRWLEQEPEVE